MTVTERSFPPILLQLMKLGARKRQSIVAACDRELRYTHLFDPHPRFDVETSIGKRDDELAPAEHVAELIALKEEVLAGGRELQRRVHVRVVDEDRVYDTTAEPIHDDAGSVIGVATAAVDVTPTKDVQALLGRVSAQLEKDSEALARRWHDQLRLRLNIRPQNVFPTANLLDGAPQVVSWMAASLTDGRNLSAADSESLREIADHWRRGGYSIEESLVHVGLLSDLLMDAVGEATFELGQGVSPVAGVEGARRICRALDTVRVVFVATYRDAEEDRFTDFGATLAHEVRGHLSAALSGVDLLAILSDPDDAELGPVIERIRHAVREANRVVRSVRALSQAATDGGQRWQYRPLDELVRGVVAERDPSGGVALEVDEDVPGVEVPAEPLHLILHNLIENAIKYCNPDAPRRWVRIHCEKDAGDGDLILHVGDNGLGIPKHEQERIFLRFRRGAAATGDGFGLGLAIVRETARKFGGRILLESEERKGSTFSVTIPASARR